MGRFLLVESCCYVVSELVKCCSRRMFRFEAVLVVDRRYVIGGRSKVCYCYVRGG